MVHLFPSRSYTARLGSTDPVVWERLQQNTELRDTLVSVRTNKLFTGQVASGKFKLISSRIGKGAFCTMEGDFTAADGSGTIRFRVHKAFRILILVWAALIVGLVAFMVWQRGVSHGWILAVQVLEAFAFLVIIHFAIEGLFRSLAKSGLKSLTELLGLVDLTEAM